MGDQEFQVPGHLLVPMLPKMIDKGKRAHRAMKIVHEHGTKRCAAFDPVTNLCTIYESRPDVCRDFQRGCQSCAMAVMMIRDKTEQHDAYKKSFQYAKEHPIPEPWKERREFNAGYRRIQVNDVWGRWTCYGCFQSARRIRDIRHELRCGKHPAFSDVLSRHKDKLVFCDK